MASKPTTNVLETALSRKVDVPIRLMDSSAYDENVSSMKQMFAAEMKKVEEAMAKFSTDLLNFYGHTTTVQSSSNRDHLATSLDVIRKSPLLEGEGENKILKLQFDMSQFEPNEVTVKVLNNILIVSATHEEKNDSRTSFRQFNREFLLPKGTNPEAVESALSTDGVLTVRAPVHLAVTDDWMTDITDSTEEIRNNPA